MPPHTIVNAVAAKVGMAPDDEVFAERAEARARTWFPTASDRRAQTMFGLFWGPRPAEPSSCALVIALGSIPKLVEHRHQFADVAHLGDHGREGFRLSDVAALVVRRAVDADLREYPGRLRSATIKPGTIRVSLILGCNRLRTRYTH